MKKFLSSIIALTFLSVSTIAAAQQESSDDFSAQWDSAVSSLLLAAGMYGSTGDSPEGVGFTVEQSKDLFKGLAIEEDKLNGQNITLSYSGSSGKLGFSAGYIYTSVRDNQEPDALLLDLDSAHQNPYNGNNPWFLALNMSTSFQVNDAFSVGFGSRAMLMKNPFEDHDGRVLSMLLNLPMSYKNYFTITPELQWSRALPGNSSQSINQSSSNANTAADKDVFYGGMSITFSY